ncbi:hypothetical protein [Streptomyces sp. TRM49041]|uniref:hypothetical protein n=1 Tax=Streptomyces sp. TRM49041 TaxID=2603216 RepID=UPI0016568758|nr:hypothetical protein [Streptomyces sp. TRM49041]
MSETETTDVRPERRRSPFAVSLMAAAVLVAGGGGTYLAVASTDRAGGGERTATAADARGGPALSPSPGGTAPGIAPGEPDPNDGGRYRVAGELPQGPDKAHAYRPQGTVTAADVERLARALGMSGSPQRDDVFGWRVGPDKDGSGAILRVYDKAPGRWEYEANGPRSDDCPKGKPCGHQGADGEPVSEEAAKRAAAPVLKGLGLGSAPVDATEVVDALRIVTADPVVGGLPTRDWATRITVDGGGGVSRASGYLTEPARGPEYPVMSAEETVRALNRAVSAPPRGGFGGCATPVPLEGGDARADVDGTAGAGTDPSRAADPCDPRSGTADPGKPARAPEEVVLIRKAVFGLAGQQEKGRAALVPSWLFEGERRGGEQVRFAFPAVPVERLAPEPGQDGVAGPTATGYSVHDRTLRVHFSGGVCSWYTVRAEETGTQVKVRVYETPFRLGAACISLAVDLSGTVTLERPLGDREVVDAGTGEPVARNGAAK